MGQVRATKHIEILMYDGFDELDAVAPFEILAAAGFAVELVTVDRAPRVRTAHGMSICPHGVLDDAPELLVVPGGGWLSRAPQGAWAEVQRGLLPAAIADRHRSGTMVAGVCSGVMLLAAAGMLRGRPAVTHHAALDDLRDSGADVRPEARVIDDGDVLTAGGVTSAIDLALHVVERERGLAAALAGARRIEHELRGEVLATSWRTGSYGSPISF
jgi:transcriptional regulator GlxA family with amidase domain